MRWFWLTVLVCFLTVSTHEVVAHGGTCGCGAGSAVKHQDEEPGPDGSGGADGDHHGDDSHGHFSGAVSVPAQPVLKIGAMPGTPIAFDFLDVPTQECVLLSLNRALGPPVPALPRYVSAQSLLL